MWGSNESGQLGIDKSSIQEISPQRVLQIDNLVNIACGIKHTLFLNKRGDVYTCGKNDAGELGLGITQAKVQSPLKINMDDQPVSKILASSYSAFLTKERKLYLAGDSPLGFFKTPTLLSHDNPIDHIGVGSDFLVPIVC